MAIRFPLGSPLRGLAAKPTERVKNALSAPLGHLSHRERQGPHPSRLRRATFPVGEGLGAGFFRAVTGICKFFLYFSIFRLFPLQVTGFSVIIPGSIYFQRKHTKTIERI